MDRMPYFNVRFYNASAPNSNVEKKAKLLQHHIFNLFRKMEKLLLGNTMLLLRTHQDGDRCHDYVVILEYKEAKLQQMDSLLRKLHEGIGKKVEANESGSPEFKIDEEDPTVLKSSNCTVDIDNL